MYTVLIISIIIVIIVLILSVVTTSKAYQYKHTVDPVDNNNSHADTNEPKSQDENK
jgi:uncharacterized protein YpmB